VLDFLMIATRSTKKGAIEVYPKFLIKKSKDLMIRGGDFYAVWDEAQNRWSLDEHAALRMIDKELVTYTEERCDKFDGEVRVLHLWDSSSGMIDNWHKYCQKQMRDSFHPLDEKLVFANEETTKEDYVTRTLTYPLESGDISAYERMMSVLYSPDERMKIEWAIGSIVTGESVNIQKFLVFYGSAGTGKSTVLNLIQKLFDGYYTVFDAKALGSTSNSFALEAFKTNPLVAIQHDGDLSRIADNTRLNSVVSHELMTVNEKFKATYASKFKCFLFMGTNKPVKITDAKSGLIRRLIDVSPTGDKLPSVEYKAVVHQLDFELGAIAYHCAEVYKNNKSKYDDYIPTTMLGASNDFYNYIEDAFYVFKDEDGVTLKTAWERYKTYCTEAHVQYPFSQRAFKEELKNYFKEYKERHVLADGTRVRSYFEGFRYDKFERVQEEDHDECPENLKTIIFNGKESEFDKQCKSCPAQYASEQGSPVMKWANVKTKLSKIDTSKLHYVKVPENHIVIDFDLTENGEKSLELNLKEASKWPETYAEVSKSGKGIHLHYIYSGDASKLSRVYDEHIEIKVFVGNASLRRKLTKFNDKPINTISSGLPLKGDKVINFDSVKNEKAIRTLIHKNIYKEYHPGTKPSIEFIHKILEDAYESGVPYDVRDMENVVFAFAASSTNHAEYCMDLVETMKFKSEDISENGVNEDVSALVFYDVEVFPNLFIVNYKAEGENKPVVRMINPTSKDIEGLLRYKLVGFNCRRYDNHILYGRLIGYTNEQLYELSMRIINNKPNAYFGEAWNISYTDVYDFSSEKKSLKKFEIELGIHHQELGLPWDQPVPEELWVKVAEYCDNDIIATEAVFHARQSDWLARQILADIAGKSVNTTTNSLSTRIIFGDNKTPQDEFNYRDMGKVDDKCSTISMTDKGVLFDNFADDEHCLFDEFNRPVFPGYKYEAGKSHYRGEVVGEGGYVYSEPGMYGNVALLDIASMHPTSAIQENLFGDVYTKKFKEIVDARLAIKHKDLDSARQMLGGALAKYLDDESLLKDLSTALKIVINSVYGLTSASFENPFRDPRNIDNIVAKRGALFMVNLKHAVQARGFTVAHIKTDSIKIPDATPEIIQFVTDYGEMYGYTFEHEATYDRLCLVNDAVYIARYSGEGVKWTATGTQFAVPYVFKKLFTGDDIEFKDLCETKSVASSIYLDMNESLPDVKEYEKERDKIWKKLLSDEPMDKSVVDDLEQRYLELEELIAPGHNYIFVGKIGLFCPIKSGHGGGILLRENNTAKNGKVGYASVTGTKGYRWLEAEMVENLGKYDSIDRSYYDNLVNDAVDSIATYGDIEWFVSEETYLKKD